MLVQAFFLAIMIVSNSVADVGNCPNYATLLQTLNYTNSAHPGDPSDDNDICILANEADNSCGGCL